MRFYGKMASNASDFFSVMSPWNKKHFFLLYGLALLFSAIVDFVWAFMPMYFLNHGYSILQLFFYEAVFYAFPVLVLPLFKKINLRTAIGFALALQILCLTVIASPLPVSWQFIIAGGLRGSALGFFWASLQTGYYEFAQSHKRAVHSANLNMIGPLMDMVLPALSGLFIQHSSIHTSVLIGLVITSIAFLCTLGLPSYTVQTPRTTYTKNFKGLRAFFFFEGGIRTATISLIPLLSLAYFKRPEQLGFFLSYLGIFGAISSLIVAYFSDKINRRRVFLRPITLIICIGLTAAILTKNSVQWIFATGLFAFFMQLLMPLSSAAAFDRHHTTETLWFAREFYYNVGRTSVMLFAIVMAWFEMEIFALIGPIFMALGYFFNLRRLQKKPHIAVDLEQLTIRE